MTPQTLSPAGEMCDYLMTLFGEQEGWLEVMTGHTSKADPSKIERDPPQGQRFHWYAPDRIDDIVEHCQTLAATCGNVYVSSSLYDRPCRPCHGSTPLPSRVVFVDDAPEAPSLPFSFCVRTSEASRHGYYLTDVPIDPETRRELQARAAHGLGGDPSGADVEQMVRVPESFNTKNHKRYPVHIEANNGDVITISPDALRAAFPTLPPRPAASITDLDAPKVTRWLAHMDQLLNGDKLPKRLVNPKGQSRRILAGEDHLSSSSEDRAAVCRGLVMHGYPDEEIAAILIHLCDYGASAKKGSRWLYADITRLLGKERANQPDVKISASLLVTQRAAAPLPNVQPRRKGRPQRLDPYGYLDWLAQNAAAGTVLKTRKEIAAELTISVPTIDRLEARLRAEGQIERHTSKDRRCSWVTLLGTIKNDPVVATNVDVVNIAAPDPVIWVLSEPSHIEDARTGGREHTPPGAPDDDDHWIEPQYLPIDMPKRQRRKRPRVEDLPLPLQVDELRSRLKSVRRAKSKAKWIGHGSQVRALERQGELIRLQLEAAEVQLAAATPPPAGEQIGLDLVPGPAFADLPFVPTSGACVPPLPDVDRPQPSRWSMSRSLPVDDWLTHLEQTGQHEQAQQYRAGMVT